VFVPAGTFLMGTADAANLEPPDWAAQELASEQPQHEVVITRGFWIDKHEVTNEAFAVFVAAGGYSTPEYWSEDGWAWVSGRRDGAPVSCGTDEPDHPRACITWYEAEAYAAWRGGRLPSEAEWEFAARGPDSLRCPWGAEWNAGLANIVDSDHSLPVGSFPAGASWVGALDMSGNVMEWVSDWWSLDYYAAADRIDPTGPERGSRKVEKGGWFGSVPYAGRSAYRHFEDPPSYQDHHIGFRIVSH
jgi:formylglycine-generating enzyme required for sulfatase activity